MQLSGKRLPLTETLKYLGVRNGKKTRSRKTPVMTLQGLQRLLVILGGRVAVEFRQIVLGVFTRYMAGDALFELEIQERKLALEQRNWHERRSAPSSAPGLGEERRFHSRAAVEKHS